MWALVASLQKSVNLRPKFLVIDNWVFRLHYRVTFTALFLAAAALWASDVFGQKIRCSHSRLEDETKSNEQLDHVINSYCYNVGAFTIPRHYIKNQTNKEIEYAGVGPIHGKEPKEYLSWYQWVYIVLMLQALSFYISHMIWRSKEGRVIANIVQGIKFLDLVDLKSREKTLKDVNKHMLNRIEHYPPWTNWLIACEALNLLNVVAQWFFNDWFLRGRFSTLGYALTEDRSDPNKFGILDIAFPKMAKCNFKDIGHTGEIQENDLVCVMTHNIVHEKLYLILWYWYIILMIVSSLALVHRIVSWTTHTLKKHNYNLLLFRNPAKLPDNRATYYLMTELTYSQFNFVHYLSSNLDPKIAVDFIENLADCLRERIYYNSYGNKHHEALVQDELITEKSNEKSVGQPNNIQFVAKEEETPDSYGRRVWLLVWKLISELQQGA